LYEKKGRKNAVGRGNHWFFRRVQKKKRHSNCKGGVGPLPRTAGSGCVKGGTHPKNLVLRTEGRGGTGTKVLANWFRRLRKRSGI